MPLPILALGAMAFLGGAAIGGGTLAAGTVAFAPETAIKIPPVPQVPLNGINQAFRDTQAAQGKLMPDTSTIALVGAVALGLYVAKRYKVI